MAPTHGIHAAADRDWSNQATVDGVNLGEMWTNFQALLDATNDNMNNLVQLLTFKTNQRVEAVLQGGEVDEMEDATEFGIPTAERLLPGYFNIGYDFREYDSRTAFSYRALRRLTSEQMNFQVASKVASYRKRIFNDMMRAIFRPTNVAATINGTAQTVYRFYNAPVDAVIPPTYGSTTFDATHTHYRVNGAAALTAANVDALLDDFDSHGYGFAAGYQVLLLVSRTQGNQMQAFRTAAAGGTGGNAGRYSFVQAVGMPGDIINTSQQLIGQSAPANTYQGLRVIGSYGNALVIQDEFIPTGYVLALASGGPLVTSNPLGWYEEPGYDGLQLMPGPSTYPIQNSYWWAGAGFGVRHRGAGIVLQVKASGTYDIPAAWA